MGGEKQGGQPGIHTECEDTYTLRLVSELPDLRVGYVHSTASGILPCEEKKVNEKKKSERI